MADPARTEVRPKALAAAACCGVVAFALAHRLPFAAGVDPGPGAAVLGTTAFVLACWLLSALPIGASSMLPVVLLPLAGAVPMRDVVLGYCHPILWLFGGGFVLAQAIERWGLHRRLAFAVLRSVGPSPRRLVMGFFLVATLVSLWINNTSVALMLLPIGAAVAHSARSGAGLDAVQADRFGACVMLGIAFGASIGGMGSPIGTAPNAIFLGNYQRLVEQGAPPISFLQWLLAFVPLSVGLALLFSWLLSAFVLPLPKGRMPDADSMLAEAKALPPMSTAERRVAGLFALAVLLWVTRGDLRLSDDLVVRGWAHWLQPEGAATEYVTDGVVAVLIAVLAFVVPSGAGPKGPKWIMDWPTVQKLPFDILFLLGAGMAMADAFKPTGVSLAFGNILAPWIGSAPPLLLVVALCVLVLVLSEVASNTAIAALFLPILQQGAVAAEMDPRVLMLPAALAASCGFMLPIATPPNTIVFASGHVRIGQMCRAGIWLDVVSIGLLLVVLWFWAFPLLGVETQGRPQWLPPK